MYRRLYAGLTLAALIILVGCSSKEGPVAPWLGDRPGQGSDPLFVNTDSVAAETTFTHVVPMGAGGVLFVGRDGGFEARSLVRFSVTDTTITEFLDGTVVITFQSGQEVAPVRFLLHRMSSLWNETSVTWERAKTDSTGDVPWVFPGGDYDPLPIAEAGPCSLQADTVRVSFTIPADIVSAIFAAGSDDNGFLVSLAGEGMDQSVWRFDSREQGVMLRPRFEVGYVDSSGTDTSKVLYAAADAALVTRAVDLDSDRLLIGSGYGLRSLIQFSIPSELDSIDTINRALMYLYCDTSLTFLETKTLQVELVDSAWQGDSTSVLGGYISQALAVPGTPEIQFDVTSAVVQWITGASENLGVLVRFSVENNAVAYCPIFTARASEPELVPRLEILYTHPPEPPVGTVLPEPDPHDTARSERVQE